MTQEVTWSGGISDASELETYHLASLPSHLEIRESQTGVLTQKIEIPGIHTLISLSGWGQGESLLISSSGLWRLCPIEIEESIETLLKIGKFQEALTLIASSTQLPELKRISLESHITISEAKFTFSHLKDYPKSFDSFLKLDLNPLEVLGLFPILEESREGGEGFIWRGELDGPTFKCKGLSCYCFFCPLFFPVLLTIKRSEFLVGYFRKLMTDYFIPSFLPFLAEQDMKRAFKALSHYLTSIRFKINHLLNHQVNEKFVPVTIPATPSIPFKPSPSFPSLSEFQFQPYDRLSKEELIYLFSIVDTAFLKSCLILGHKSLVESLMRLENGVDGAVAERILIKVQWTSSLIELWKGKGQNQRALEYLTT